MVFGIKLFRFYVVLAGRSGLVVARSPVAREVPGSNRAAVKKNYAFFTKITAVRGFGHGLYNYCSV